MVLDYGTEPIGGSASNHMWRSELSQSLPLFGASDYVQKSSDVHLLGTSDLVQTMSKMGRLSRFFIFCKVLQIWKIFKGRPEFRKENLADFADGSK